MLPNKHIPAKPLIIPIFLPHAGCPHRCVFCNQTAITQSVNRMPSLVEFHKTVEFFLKFRAEASQRVQIAFYGGNFLGLPQTECQALLAACCGYVNAGQVQSIRFSTRPDTITAQTLNWVSNYPVETVELGVQSMSEAVLQRAGRGHTSQDTVEAVHRLKTSGFETGAQIMIGLPGDSAAQCLRTARIIADLAVDFVRVYPTVVLKGSRLADWYAQGRYMPPDLEETIQIAKSIYLLLAAQGVPVIRMGLQAQTELDDGAVMLAGPYHPAFGHLVMARIFLDKAAALMSAQGIHHAAVDLKVHPRSLSRMRGLKNRNTTTLIRRFDLKALRILPDPAIAEDDLTLTAY